MATELALPVRTLKSPPLVLHWGMVMFSNEHRYVCRLQIRFLCPSHCAHAGKAQHPGVHWDHMRNFTQALLTVAFIGYLKNVAPAVTQWKCVCELIMIYRHIHYIHTVKILKCVDYFMCAHTLHRLPNIFGVCVTERQVVCHHLWFYHRGGDGNHVRATRSPCFLFPI